MTRSANFIAAAAILFFLSNSACAQWPEYQAGESSIQQPTDCCGQANCDCPKCHKPRLSITGWRGTPYRDPVQGGCKCSRRHGYTQFHSYEHWTSPFSALIDYGRDGDRCRRTADTRNGRPSDCLDRLAHIKLINYKRRDNGHSGRDCDPWGKLSDSRRGFVLADDSASSTENRAPQSKNQVAGFGWATQTKK